MQNQYSFAIHTLGCKVNTYESDAMAEKLRASGFIECGFDERADVYIINTCTVTNVADKKSRQMLRRARKVNPEALVVATGCYVDDAAKNDKLEGLINEHVIDVAVSNKDKSKILELINEKLSVSREISVENEFLTELDGHTRAFIKVQDGCNMYCSYCIIPYVRGPLKARPVDEVLQEIELLGKNGTAETVITGIHLSSLGDGLLDIIAGIEKIDSIKRVRLGSLEPRLITDHFVSELKKYKKLCPHFHLSLQSGNDEVLKRMNRHYTADEYAESCEIIRKYYDHPAITTDIIVGFPGETDEQFADSCRFAERVGLYEAHVFKYSRRAGTVADRMPDQIPEQVKAVRSDELIRVTDRLSSDFRKELLGKEVEFLSEELIEIDGVSYETGYTPEYVRCLKQSEILHQNELIVGKASRIVHQNNIDESLLLV